MASLVQPRHHPELTFPLPDGTCDRSHRTPAQTRELTFPLPDRTCDRSHRTPAQAHELTFPLASRTIPTHSRCPGTCRTAFLHHLSPLQPSSGRQ
eukprot:1307971-Prymnesium_polylepis.2